MNETKYIPKGFQKTDSILNGERPERSQPYVRTRDHEKIENGFLKGEGYIWQNGVMVPWNEAKVHVLTHALHYGSGVFEGIKCYDTERGSAIFRLAEHIDRLFFSAEAMGMIVPYTKDEIKKAIIEVVKINNLKSCYVRPICFYGYGKMGVRPEGIPIEVAVACWPWNSYFENSEVDIKISKYTRIDPTSTVVAAKICGHYVNSILASLELRGTPYHEVMLLDKHGNIAEASAANFFMVKNNIIHTPRTDFVLNGITRDTIICIACDLGFEVIETDISVEEAMSADELFLTGTAAEIVSIRSISDTLVGSGATHVTNKLRQEFRTLISGGNPKYDNYLTFL